jgi:hypothetical protein
MNNKLFIKGLFFYLIVTIPVNIFDLCGKNHNLIASFLYLIPPLFVLFAIYSVIRQFGFHHKQGKAFLCISFGFIFALIGEITFLILEFILHKPPYPSLADGFLFLGYFFFFAGFLYEIKAVTIRWTSMKILIVTLCSVIFGLTIIYFGVFQAYNASHTLLRNIVDVTYGMSYFLLYVTNTAVFLLVLEYKKGKLYIPWSYIFVGLALIFLGNIVYAQLQTEYMTKTFYYRYIDLLWFIGFLAISYGVYEIMWIISEVKKKISKQITTNHDLKQK